MNSNATMSWPIIMMEDMTKVFRQSGVEARVLNGIDLNIHRGEFVVVHGPSGC